MAFCSWLSAPFATLPVAQTFSAFFTEGLLVELLEFLLDFLLLAVVVAVRVVLGVLAVLDVVVEVLDVVDALELEELAAEAVGRSHTLCCVAVL